jgi:aspartyl-tRNA(Asn)/glutamyl-tRNA(Gln) amidotransferase subunit A
MTYSPGSDLAFASIEQLGSMLRSKQLSSRELTRFALDRLERLGPQLNSVAALLPDRTLKAADAADKELAAGTDRGPLHGIPYGAKDLLAATGAPTTWGAEPYRHQTFDYDAEVISRLTQAGAVLVAKLAMIELAGGMGYNQADASITGPCKTPWNTDYWSGGSSSGSGASVAAGLVTFAIGSETDGSITNPSAYCGCSGLRPTYGRVSRYGAMPLSWTLDKLGPLCRSARDAGLVFDAIAGYDPKDFTSVRVEAQSQPQTLPPAGSVPARRWRMATVGGTGEKLQPAVAANFEASLKVLRRFGPISHVMLPKFPYDSMVGAVIAAEAASSFRTIIEDGRVRQLGDLSSHHSAYSYLVVNAVDYVDAMRQRAALRTAFDELFESVDVLVAPTFSTVAPPIDKPFDKAYPGTNDGELITACNLAGIPAVSVPNGFGLHGLPTGLMFAGPAFSEASLVEIAAAYQSQTGYHRLDPPAFAQQKT